MKNDRAALLASKMSGVWPALGVSNTTVALWAERFTQYPEDVCITVSAKAMANLKEPPSSSELRDLLRNAAQTEMAPLPLPGYAPAGVTCQPCGEVLYEDSEGNLVHNDPPRFANMGAYLASEWHAGHDPNASCYPCRRKLELADLAEAVAK